MQYFHFLNKRGTRNTLLLIVLTWYFFLFVFELLWFHRAVGNCNWTSPVPHDRKTEYSFTRMAIVADPQLTDKYSYDYMSEKSLLLALTQFYSDFYMKKNFGLLQRYHSPDAIVLLGDLFDGAKILNIEEYEEEYQRFNWVFERQKGQTYFLFNMSGNHDIGFRVGDLQNTLTELYRNHFGPLNYYIKLNGFSFLFLSTLTLDEDPTTPFALLNETQWFLQSVVQQIEDGGLGPTILFTHVPLWRPEESDCGKYSTEGPIRNRVGYSYTNTVPRHTTEYLLTHLNPLHVFSGDSHDQCYYEHHVQGQKENNNRFEQRNAIVPEHTIGTFSWLQGIPSPSFALVTFAFHPTNSPLVSVRLCFLPRQLFIYLFYVFLFLVSLVLWFWQLISPRSPLGTKSFRLQKKPHTQLMADFFSGMFLAILAILPVYLFLLSVYL